MVAQQPLGNVELNNYIKMPSGIIVSEETAEAYAKRWQRPKGIDVFAGCGGMSLGLIQGGCEVVAAIEKWPTAAVTYMTNLGTNPCQFHFVEDSDAQAMEKEILNSIKRSARKNNGIAQMPASGSGWISHQPCGTPGVGHFFLGDVRKLTGRQILSTLGLERGELDILCGGPPCQGFSRAGARDVMDPRNSLVFDFARLVCELQPKTMVMENVPGIIDMVTPDGVPVIDAFCRILEDGGFGGIDSFLRSIKAQTGSVGLLRGKPKKAAQKKKSMSSQRQRGLFEEEAA